MISFYPGPSRVYDSVPGFVKEAHQKGILSLNHRSKEFEKLSEQTVGLLREKLGIPSRYTVLFTSSATECWEVIAQSLVVAESIHLYNGAFGEKWFDYTRRLHPATSGHPFDRETALDTSSAIYTSGEVICLTQNETSNGTQIANATIQAIRKNNPRHVIAVDATSSMAGIKLNFAAADVWFASVQKCFGLPAGLAVMAISPKGIKQALQINEAKHYNSLPFMIQMMDKWQTPCTPNVLGIYLLMRSLQSRPAIAAVHEETTQRAGGWYSFLNTTDAFEPLISTPAVRSHTVLAVKSTRLSLEQLKKDAIQLGFLLGEGYGALKKDTFRIANFPALRKKEIGMLMKFLGTY